MAHRWRTSGNQQRQENELEQVRLIRLINKGGRTTRGRKCKTRQNTQGGDVLK